MTDLVKLAIRIYLAAEWLGPLVKRHGTGPEREVWSSIYQHAQQIYREAERRQKEGV